MDKCIAAGPGWKCSQIGELKGYCVAHYAQERRGGEFRPLRGAHGKSLEKRLKISFDAPVKDVTAVRSEAKRRGDPDSDLYREALALFAGKLKGGK